MKKRYLILPMMCGLLSCAYATDAFTVCNNQMNSIVGSIKQESSEALYHPTTTDLQTGTVSMQFSDNWQGSETHPVLDVRGMQLLAFDGTEMHPQYIYEGDGAFRWVLKDQHNNQQAGLKYMIQDVCLANHELILKVVNVPHVI
jgi:hypothetical protein